MPNNNPTGINQYTRGGMRPVKLNYVGKKKAEAVFARANKTAPDWRYGMERTRKMSIPISKLHSVQGTVSKKTVNKYRTSVRNQAPLVFKHGNQFYVANGTHRTEAALSRSNKNIRVRVIKI